MAQFRTRNSSAYLARRRWTAEEAGQALAALDGSGLPLLEFAQREGVQPQRLLRWRRRLAAPTSAVFEEVVPVRVAEGEADARASAGCFEVVLSSGRVVRVPASFESDALRRLLAVVEEA